MNWHSTTRTANEVLGTKQTNWKQSHCEVRKVLILCKFWAVSTIAFLYVKMKTDFCKRWYRPKQHSLILKSFIGLWVKKSKGTSYVRNVTNLMALMLWRTANLNWWPIREMGVSSDSNWRAHCGELKLGSCPSQASKICSQNCCK